MVSQFSHPFSTVSYSSQTSYKPGFLQQVLEAELGCDENVKFQILFYDKQKTRAL